MQSRTIAFTFKTAVTSCSFVCGCSQHMTNIDKRARICVKLLFYYMLHGISVHKHHVWATLDITSNRKACAAVCEDCTTGTVTIYNLMYC